MPGLRVLAGPTLNTLVPITDYVNTNKPYIICSRYFEGQVVANIKGFVDCQGRMRDSEYFDREERRGVTWSIQVQGRFLQPHSADDILFGNTFDRPLQLPWGSGAALKFMSYIDPTLEHDLTSRTKPWALSPLISTMPHFAHTQISDPSRSLSRSSSSSDSSYGSRAYYHESGHATALPPFPPRRSLRDDTSQIHRARVQRVQPSPTIPGRDSPPSSASSSSSSLSAGSSKFRNALGSPGKAKHVRVGEGEPLGLQNAAQRRAFFSLPENRRGVEFGPRDVITTDFCYGFLEFSPKLSLRLPGGVSFDLERYWDGQPVRFVCCERKRDRGGEPWGRVFWCVAIEMCD